MSALGYEQFTRRDAIRSQAEQHISSFPAGYSAGHAPIAIDVPDMCSPDLWGAYNERTAQSRFVPIMLTIAFGIIAGSLIGAALTAMKWVLL